MDKQQENLASPRNNPSSNEENLNEQNAQHLEKREKLWWAEHEVPDTSNNPRKAGEETDRER